jgi:hypothetical protein
MMAKEKAKEQAKKDKAAKGKPAAESAETTKDKSGFSLRRMFGSSKKNEEAVPSVSDETSTSTEIPTPSLDEVFAESTSPRVLEDKVSELDTSAATSVVHQEPEFTLLPVLGASNDLTFPDPSATYEPIDVPSGFTEPDELKETPEGPRELEAVAIDDLIASTLQQLEHADAPVMQDANDVESEELEALAAELEAVATELDSLTEADDPVQSELEPASKTVDPDEVALSPAPAVALDVPATAENVVAQDESIDEVSLIEDVVGEEASPEAPPADPEPIMEAPTTIVEEPVEEPEPAIEAQAKAAEEPTPSVAAAEQQPHPVAEISSRKYRGSVPKALPTQVAKPTSTPRPKPKSKTDATKVDVAPDSARQQEREVRDRIAHKHRELQRMFGRIS